VRSLERVHRNRQGWCKKKGKVLSPATTKKGYQIVRLMRNGKGTCKAIHIYVLLAFVGEKPSDKEEIRHLDGNPANNHLSNLAYATRLENQADRKLHGTLGHRLTEEQVKDILWLCSFFSQREVANYMSVSAAHISKIMRKKSWTYLTE
jgi:hypothetical protein